MKLVARRAGIVALLIGVFLVIAAALVAASTLTAATDPAPSKTPDVKPTPTDGKTATSSAFTTITYDITGGFAGFQRKITFTPDGKFQIRDARPPKSADGELTKDELAELTKRAAAVDWKTTDARYINPQVADGFNNAITVVAGAETHKTVVGDPGPAKVPEAVAALNKVLKDLRQKYEQAVAKGGK